MPRILRSNLPEHSTRPTSGHVAHEDTPLLHKAIFFYPTPSSRRASAPSKFKSPAASVLPVLPELPELPSLFTRPILPRRSSTSSSQSGKYLHEGRSTFGQTVCMISFFVWVRVVNSNISWQLFNCIAVLLGIGMLSEPLAFAYSGWIAGTALIVSYGFISCYTLRLSVDRNIVNMDCNISFRLVPKYLPE